MSAILVWVKVTAFERIFHTQNGNSFACFFYAACLPARSKQAHHALQTKAIFLVSNNPS
jgi:hypothetical protein